MCWLVVGLLCVVVGLLGCSVCWLVGCSVCCLVVKLCCCVCWLVGCWVVLYVGWLIVGLLCVLICCLLACLLQEWNVTIKVLYIHQNTIYWMFDSNSFFSIRCH